MWIGEEDIASHMDDHRSAFVLYRFPQHLCESNRLIVPMPMRLWSAKAGAIGTRTDLITLFKVAFNAMQTLMD